MFSDIPVLDVGPDFPLETLLADKPRVAALLDGATAGYPASALRLADRLSRRWLERTDNLHLPEIDAIARHIGRPGAYFLSVNYEWGCTTAVRPGPDRASARLTRVLDWRTPGLGRHIVAARVKAEAGPFITLTWPGYTGVLQAVAPGRFAAALNQAPMANPIGLLALDWAVNRGRVWRKPHGTASHLLRRVFEHAADFEEARDMLMREPIAAPAIYALAGTRPQELATIERLEEDAVLHAGRRQAANHFDSPGWYGRPRGEASAERARMMSEIDAPLAADFSWLKPPILNPTTRLVMVADAKDGRLVAQGFEATGPATRILELTA
ncbi:MAG: hypothetical protein R3D31_11915 [Hyphomicrobiaceae bacterium]